MESAGIKLAQKRAEIDLYIIVAAAAAVLFVFLGFQEILTEYAVNKSIPVLLRTTVVALQQFGIAGLGIVIVALIRKESFLKYGLGRKGCVKSILLCAAAFIPHIVFMAVTGRITGYLPFQSVWMTREVLASPVPVNIIGMLIIAVAWGFFEEFNYVVISDKINQRFPVKYKWLNWGAIFCGILCILIHGMVGVTPESIVEALTVFAAIYGMLMARDYTSNAWGCVFVFVFVWNAF